MITRRAYTTRKGVHVPAHRVKDMGALGKWASKHGEGIGELQPGELGRYGYSGRANRTMRHRALRKAVAKYGPLSTFRKLNAISTYTKRTSTHTSKRFRADRDWVKREFMKH